MDFIVKIILINTVISGLFAKSYNSNLIDHKFFFKNMFNLLQLIITFFMPLIYAVLIIIVFLRIYQNPLKSYKYYSETLFVIINTILIAIGFLGLGIHLTSKSFSYFLPKKGKLWQLNTFFHIHLSHLFIFTSFIIGFVNVILFEFIHPHPITLVKFDFILLMIFGIILGICLSLMIIRANDLEGFYFILCTICAFIGIRFTIENIYNLPISIYLSASLITTSIFLFFYIVPYREL